MVSGFVRGHSFQVGMCGLLLLAVLSAGALPVAARPQPFAGGTAAPAAGLDPAGWQTARWEMDEGAGTVLGDASGHGRDGTLNGATWSTSVFSGALSFDGVDDFVTIPHDFDPGMGSVTAWVKTTAAMGVVLAEGHSTQQGPYFMLLVENGRLGIYRDSSLGRAAGDTLVNDGQWHFVAWTQTGAAGGLRLYVDGRAETLTWSEGSDTGAWFDDCSGNTYALGQLTRPSSRLSFSGDLDRVIVWDHALTASAVSRLYTERNLIARWNMDEGTGAVLLDSSGHGRDGTLNGATWATGVFSGGLGFDGVDDFVTVPHDFDPGQGSVTAWVKTTAATAVVFAEGYGSQHSPYYMLLVENSRAAIYRSSGGGRAQGDTMVSDGQWHFIAWTQTGAADGLKIYVDGHEDTLAWSEGSNDGAWFDDCSGDNHTIGILQRSAPFGAFPGYLDQVNVYDRALAADEVGAFKLYRVTLPAMMRNP